MKTKYLLSALALPALLAACVNDDFMEVKSPVESPVNDLLAGRATGHVNLNAVKGEGQADTRVVGEFGPGGAIDWYWQPTDQIGGVVVDYGTNEAIVGPSNGYDDYVITNYNFSSNLKEPSQSSTFSTPSAVVQGAYIFYNQYDAANTERRQLRADLGEYMTVKTGVEAGLEQVGTDEGKGQNFFISPILDVAIPATDAGAELEVPVGLTSVYSVLRVHLETDLQPTSTTDYYRNGFRVYKIEIEPTKDGDNFERAFVLDPVKLAEVQKTVENENPGLAHVFKGNGAIQTKGNGITENDVRTAISRVLEKIADPDTEIGETVNDGTSTKLIYQIEDAVFNRPEDVCELLVLIPAGNYGKNQDPLELGNEGVEYGALKMSVYTSEGVYSTYVVRDNAGNADKWNEDGTYTFQRGRQIAVGRTMYIRGGQTNIDLYDFTGKGMDVANTADWEYAIDYINNHQRDFGTPGSNWREPILNLSNYDGPIEVDAEHYFPNFPVIYRTAEGETTSPVLQLVGQENYELNPANVILSANKQQCGRPTLLIEEQPTSTVAFANAEVEKDAEDQVDYTAAWKLDSDAKINVAQGQTLTFELLTTDTEMNIGKGATVNVEDDYALTNNGTITLAEGGSNNETTLNVAGILDNNADASLIINKYATVNLNENEFSENDGLIDVTGRLNAYKLHNNEGATLNVHSWEVEMDNNIRGIAKIDALMNEGTIDIEKRKQNDSGTYGGELIVSQTLDNRNQVTVNGLLTVDGTTAGDGLSNRKGAVITLGSDPYAQIVIETNKGANDGIIVLNDPTRYEFYDGYLNGSQKLATYKGVIQATLNQEDYDEVMENYDTYNTTGQETAWNVINKVIVDGNLNLGVDMGQLDGEDSNKDFFLADGATLNAQGSLTLESLTTEGTATLTAQNANTVVTVKKNVNVVADLTISANVKMVITPSTETMLTVAQGATLTNNGWIDTVEGPAGNGNKINTVINGALINQGKLSNESQPVYDGTAYDNVAGILKGLKGDNDYYVGEWDVKQPRAMLLNVAYANIENATAEFGDEATWKNSANQKRMTETQIRTILTGNNGKQVELTKIGEYQVIAAEASTFGYTYVIYIPKSMELENLDVMSESAFLDAAFDFADGTIGSMPYDYKTWFNVTSLEGGMLDLRYAETHSDSWAYGVANRRGGRVEGDFNNLWEIKL